MHYLKLYTRFLLATMACAGLVLVVQHGFGNRGQLAPPESGIAGYHYPIADTNLADLPASRFDQQPNEDLLDWIQRVQNDVHETTYNCLPSVFRLSWLELLILKLTADKSTQATLFEQGVLSPLRLKCGFCHQRAVVLASLLRERGIPTRILGLNGHVVASFSIDDRPYVSDPDFGAGPFAYSDNPQKLGQLVERAYAKLTRPHISEIRGLYITQDDNIFYEIDMFAIKEKQEDLFRKADSAAQFITLFAILCLLPLIGRRLKNALRLTDKAPVP